MNRKLSTVPASRQSGITLVEIMIAMLIGLLLAGGIQQVFYSSRLTYRVHEATSRMQETGRMAMEMISRDIRMAGFWGCASDLANVVNNLNTAGAGYIDFGAGGIGGTDGGTGSDTLVLRGGTGNGIQLQAPFGPTTSSPLTVSTGNGLSAGDLVIVADCTNADVIEITNSDPDGTGQIAHRTGTASPGNVNVTDPGCVGASAHCLSKIYASDAMVYATNEVTYSVGNDGVTGQASLMRDGQVFLNGVEELQIFYGVDTDADGTPGSGIANFYVDQSQVADMTEVVSVRVAVVVVSLTDNLTGGANQNYTVFDDNRTAADTRLRQVYTTTVTVRNRL